MGNVYVINGSAHSPDNDWLVVYDESSGTELKRVVLTNVDPALKSPAALVAFTVLRRYVVFDVVH